jgi:hypothetical protein
MFKTKDWHNLRGTQKASEYIKLGWIGSGLLFTILSIFPNSYLDLYFYCINLSLLLPYIILYFYNKYHHKDSQATHFSRPRSPKILVVKRSEYKHFIREANEYGSTSFRQVLKYFKYNCLDFNKTKLKKYYRVIIYQS